MNVYLNAAGQSQLDKLKSVNALPLTRLDAQRKAVEKQKDAVSSLTKESDDVKVTLQKLREETDPEKKAQAVADFVKEFNELQSALSKNTGKDGTLSRAFELRSARFDLRSPFSNYDTLTAFGNLGVQTTRDGLVLGTAQGDGAIAPEALDAIEGALTRVQERLQSSSENMQRRLDTLQDRRERLEYLVEQRNRRTEASFLKMYQLTQAINQANASGGSQGFSAFA